MAPVNFLLPFIISVMVSLCTIPLIIFLARRFGFVDDPRTHRHPAIVHTKIIPRAGGIPIFLGVLVPTLLFVPMSRELLAILAGCILIVFVGTLDDKYDLHPYLRFTTNVVAALMVITAGIGIAFVTNPFGGILDLTNPLIMTPFGIRPQDLFTIIWIPWVMNMVNWSKGVDGQMPGIVVIAALTIGVLALRTVDAEPRQLTAAVIAFSLAGASLGFLYYNWHPAMMFPGYGATITGFLLAVLSIYASSKVATALLVLGVPTVDALFIITRRLLSRKNPFFGDRLHLHHRLHDVGWSHEHIALFYWFLCAILGSAALGLSAQGKLFAVIAVTLVVGGGILWLRFALDSSKVYDHDSG